MSSKFSVKRAWHAPQSLRLMTAGTVAAAMTVVAAIAVGGVAVASDTAAAKTITACFKPGTSPAPLSVPLGKESCPSADKILTWNKVGPQGPKGATGPQGPAGASAGVSGTSLNDVTLNVDTLTTVLQSAPVQTSGVYYLNADATLEVAAGDVVACDVGDASGDSGFFSDAGGSSTATEVTLPVTATLNLSAGETALVQCVDTQGDPNTFYFQGTLTGTLINNPNPAQPQALRARGARDLKGVLVALLPHRR